MVTYSERPGQRRSRHRREVAGELPLDQIRGFRFRELAVGEHAYAGALRFFARGDLDGEPTAPPVLRRYLQRGPA